MKIKKPVLWCAARDIEPGTVRIDWKSEGLPHSLTLRGIYASNTVMQYASAQSDQERNLLLRTIIENCAAKVQAANV